MSGENSPGHLFGRASDSNLPAQRLAGDRVARVDRHRPRAGLDRRLALARCHARLREPHLGVGGIGILFHRLAKEFDLGRVAERLGANSLCQNWLPTTPKSSRLTGVRPTNPMRELPNASCIGGWIGCTPSTTLRATLRIVKEGGRGLPRHWDPPPHEPRPNRARSAFGPLAGGKYDSRQQRARLGDPRGPRT